jgi:hypothetical protein
LDAKRHFAQTRDNLRKQLEDIAFVIIIASHNYLLPSKKILHMKPLIFFTTIFLTASFHVFGQTNLPAADTNSAPTVETLIVIRHGEKPHGGLGQLTCRGLNRALALPEVLLKRYGTPQFIFAPNPTEKVDYKDGKGGYNYVRPLITIEPTAVRCGLPVNTQYGYTEIEGLEDEFQKPQYQNTTTFIAWEHGLLDKFAKNLVKDNGGDPARVPPWPDSEYDMIFVFKITTDHDHKTVSFTVEHEGLNGLSDTCP